MPPTPPNDLTQRELQVWAYLGAGWPDKRIADEMGVSDCSVKLHSKKVREKIGVASRTQAALAWHKADMSRALASARMGGSR